MKRRLLKKTGLFLLFLWTAGSMAFFLVRAVPGDPILSILGPHPRPEDVLRLRHSLQLDRPLAAQYLHFLRRLAVLDLGESLVNRKPVLATFLKYLPNTIRLTVAAMAVTLSLSLPLAFLAAVRRGRFWKVLAVAFSAIGLAVPAFLLGILLIIALSLGLKLFPVSGSGGARFLALPALTLGISLSAYLTRMVRTVLQAEAERPYVLLARAKGLSEAQVFRRHVLKNAMIPIITLIGLQLGALLSGAVVIESIFSWPGVGTLLITAVRQRDFPMIQGTILLMAALYLLTNLLVDLSYPLIDPRIDHDPAE